VIAGPTLREDPRNRRLQLRAGLPRGGIRFADGEVLVRSVAVGGGRYRREYRGPAGLATTVGYLSSRLGASGLEAAYDAHLRGATVESWLARLPPADGRRPGATPPDLWTTLQSRVQEAAERSMAGRRGAVVALDPKTGEVLALVSLPGWAADRVDEEWESLRRRPDSPLLHRALSGLYPPGSAFKPAVALAAMEGGRTRPEERFVCLGRRIVRGQTISDLGGAVHGPLDLARAMEVSCNYVFSGLAMRLEPAELARRVARYGLLDPARVGLPAAVGHFPDPARLTREDLAEVGIGQGSLLFTPLALARLAALLANGGNTVEPHLVRGLGFPGRGTVSLGAGRTPRQRAAARPAAVAAVNRLLERAVAGGTGWRAGLAAVRVAGKTGSAENPHGDPHAWFVGFAPVEDPAVAVAVVVENGGLGGTVAAPVAREVIAAALRH
jgi:peptidoglycan glycosyltransferase